MLCQPRASLEKQMPHPLLVSTLTIWFTTIQIAAHWIDQTDMHVQESARCESTLHILAFTNNFTKKSLIDGLQLLHCLNWPSVLILWLDLSNKMSNE
jgi:hypothetical protein